MLIRGCCAPWPHLETMKVTEAAVSADHYLKDTPQVYEWKVHTIVGYFRFLSEKSENKFLSFPQRGFCGAHRAVAWIFYEFSTHSADHTNASKIVILTMLQAVN